jgi:hypothetical protein
VDVDEGKLDADRAAADHKFNEHPQVRASRERRATRRATELEALIATTVGQMGKRYPARVDKLRAQYDRGVLTDEEFIISVARMFVHQGDIAPKK